MTVQTEAKTVKPNYMKHDFMQKEGQERRSWYFQEPQWQG